MIVARRYANALYEEAQRQSKTERVDRDVELIRAALEASRELVGFFRSPIISREKKELIVREIFVSDIDKLTMDFLSLLIEKQREDIFPDIVDAYREMRDVHLGVVEARVRVAKPMGEAEQKTLANALSSMTGKKVRLQVAEEKDLIGGVVIRIGDTVYDGSVRHQLEVLRDRMEMGSHILN